MMDFSYLRSDHLKAVLIYALEQMKISEVAVLDFGENENSLDFEEQIEQVEEMLMIVNGVTPDGNCDLDIIPRDALGVLVLDSMVTHFKAGTTLEQIKDDFWNDRGLLGIDEDLIDDCYEDFVKIKKIMEPGE